MAIRACTARNAATRFRLPILVGSYKNKGSSEDFTKYRFICLLSHASKVISVCLLRRLVHETDWYLPVHQAGFRQNRGTRDNIYILAQIMDALASIDG